jgi:3-hydroxyisobutyrate dehydrogenase-like beta-hydroxyacid dehydrogenase
MSKPKIGFFGLGKMGTPMARRLIEVGKYPLVVSTRTLSKTKPFEEMGAEVAKTPKELAEKSDIIITAILGDPELKSVYLGENGILKGAKEGLIAIDITTVTPNASKEVAEVAEEKKVKFLRAPVSGSTVLAEQGQLTFIISGDRDAYEECIPIFEVLGRAHLYVGEKEEARVTKLLLNMMVAANSLLMAEALTFGEKHGVDWKTMLETINNSVVGNPLIGYKTKPLLERDFTPAFTIKQMQKDMEYALKAASEMGVFTPTTALVRQFLTAAESQGLGEKDFFSLLLVLEKLSGIER